MCPWGCTASLKELPLCSRRQLQASTSSPARCSLMLEEHVSRAATALTTLTCQSSAAASLYERQRHHPPHLATLADAHPVCQVSEATHWQLEQ